jgi:hypothetical protein
MIEIVYFLSKGSGSNKTKTFNGPRAFHLWVKQNAEILMDYTVMKSPRGMPLKLHFRGDEMIDGNESEYKPVKRKLKNDKKTKTRKKQ